MTITRIILKRIPGLLLVILGVTLITFLISHLIPADVARLIAGDHASKEVVEHIRTSLGLDQPIYIQYGIYLQNLLHGDLGTSIRSGQPVLDELFTAFPATAELAITAFILIIVFGIFLGSIAAYFQNSIIDQTIRILSVISISSPTFWTGLLFIFFFYNKLGILPAGGRLPAGIINVPHYSGLLLLDSLIAGNLHIFWLALKHIILPASTLSLMSIGSVARLIRSSILETLGADFVKRGRAAGLSEWTVMTRYVLPNSILPVITTLGLYLADLLAGTIITEKIFSWPGIGTFTMQAIASLDFPAIMGFTLLAAAIYALANLTIDIAYMIADPRIRGEI